MKKEKIQTFRQTCRELVEPQAKALADALAQSKAEQRQLVEGMHPAARFRSTEFDKFHASAYYESEPLSKQEFGDFHRRIGARLQRENRMAAGRLWPKLEALISAALDAPDKAVAPFRDALMEFLDGWKPQGARPDPFQARIIEDRLLKEAEGLERLLRDRRDLNRLTLMDIEKATRIFSDGQPDQVGPSAPQDKPEWTPPGAGTDGRQDAPRSGSISESSAATATAQATAKAFAGENHASAPDNLTARIMAHVSESRENVHIDGIDGD